MARKSLGTLTLDIVARTGGFIQSMDKAERSSAKWRKQVEKNARAAGKAIGAASAVAVTGMAVWIKNSIDGAAEIENLAKVAGTSAVEFQRFAAGARTVGIENEKLSDIFKDVNDKVGDFLVTGGGPMADFFEKVAPLVGVTADQFRNLSGPDALGLYVDTLEKAGANSQEMTFFLEALASDTTALLPLLRNGGSELKSMADEAENLGLILSNETVAGAKQFKDDMDQLGRVANSVGQQVAAELLPELSNLTDLLRDPATAEAAADMAKAVVASFTTIIDGARNTVQFIQWAAESAAAFMGGIAADDIVRLNDEIERLEQMKAGGALDRLVFFGRDGMVSYYNDAELDAELVKLRAAVEAAMQGSAPVKIKAEPELITTPPGTGLNLGGGSGGGGGTGSSGEVVDAIAKEITALERAAATWGMTAGEVKLYGLEVQGATEAQLDRARAALEEVAAMEKAKDQQEAYLRLVKDLRTDEERLTDQFHERIAILDAVAESSSIAADEYARMASRAAEAAFSDAPSFSGLAPEIGGPFGELDKIDEAQSQLQEWYDTQLQMLEQFREERSDLNAQWDEQEAALQQEHQDRLADIERARQMAQLAAGEEFFGSMAGAAKVFFGENSKLYRAAFALEKSYAISKALMNVPKSYSDAFSAVVGIPIVGPALAPAAGVAAAAAQVAQAAAIGNINMTGMAHDGIDSVPKTGTWLLEKGERVTTAETSAKLDATLDRVARGQGGSGGVVVNLIEDSSRAGQVDQRDDPSSDQGKIIDVFVSNIQSDGRAAQAIQNKWGLSAKGR